MAISFLKKGNKIKITKTLVFGNTKMPVGDVMKGVLANDVEINHGIYFLGSGNTTPIRSFTVTEDGDLIIVTDTSHYFATLWIA